MPDPRDFDEIEAESSQKEQSTQEFLDDTRNEAVYHRYEQNRVEGKQGLKNMLAYYRGREKGDDALAAIMANLEEYAAFDSTSESSYWKESDAFAKSIEAMEKYLEDLDAQETALTEASRQVFYQDNHWLTEEEIEASGDEALQELNSKLNRQQDKIDNKRMLVADFKHYLEAQTLGRMFDKVPPAVKIANQPLTEKDREVLDKIFNKGEVLLEIPKGKFAPRGVKNPPLLPGRHIDGTNVRLNPSGSITIKKDAPLFSHEPCADDITQGGVGDCYYLSSMAKIANLYPEKIKEMMRENENGTVTVRFFARNEEGQYAPLYVTVDKAFETDGWGDINNAQNCIWANCLERALAVSGLMARARDNWYCESVPDNIQAVYKVLEEKQKAGELKGEKLKQAQKAYPWLFQKNDDNIKLIPWPSIRSIESGMEALTTEMMLGPGYDFSTLVWKNTPKDAVELEQMQNRIYDTIRQQIDRNLSVGAGTKNSSHSLVPGHAYTILDTYEHEGRKYIRLRNPHGTEASAPFSGESLINVDKEQGIFDLELSKFTEIFEYVCTNGEHKDELRISVEPPKNRAESLELMDPDFIKSPNILGMFLSMAPFVEFEEKIPNYNLVQRNPDGHLTNSYWGMYMEEGLKKLQEEHEKKQKELPGEGEKTIPEDSKKKLPASLKADFVSFRSRLQEKINACYPPAGEERSIGEIMNQVKESLKKSETELLACGDKECEPYLKDALKQIVARTEKIAEQAQAGKLPGEEKLDELYNKLKAKMDRTPGQNELLVHKKENAYDANVLEENVELYRNEDGVRMVRFQGGSSITFREAMLQMDAFVFKDKRIEAALGQMEPGEPIPAPQPPQQGRERVGEDIGYGSFIQYKKILNDLDVTLCTEKDWRGKSSPESEALRSAVKDVQAALAGKSRIGFAQLQEQLNRLTEPLEAYERHCEENPRRLTRRQNRLKACGMLKNLQKSAENRQADPLKEYQKSYTVRIVQAGAQAQRKEYTPEQASQIADNMLKDAQFRGFISNQNVFHMQNSTGREIGKDMKIMMNEADKGRRQDEVKAVNKYIDPQVRR